MQQWLTAWRTFPYEAGKWTARYINDMLFKFRDEYFKVIESRYTIRDRAFIRRTIKIDKARPRSHMADIIGLIGTWYGASAESGEGGSSIRFSGFEEEITGRVSAVSRPHHRVILPAGRMGGTMAGKAQGWARMHPGQKIPSIIDTEVADIPEESRFSAMVRMMGSGKIAHSPSNTFILEGGKYKRGLYRFKGGALPRGGQKARELDLEMIQSFKDKPILPSRWDWQGETIEKVQQAFPPSRIFDEYIAKAVLGIMPEKKPFAGK
jgi:hypothetical protein